MTEKAVVALAVDPEELRALALKIRYDLTASQAKLTDLLELIARLPAAAKPGKVLCSKCQLGFPTTQRLAEHLENVHGLPFTREKVEL